MSRCPLMHKGDYVCAQHNDNYLFLILRGTVGHTGSLRFERKKTNKMSYTDITVLERTYLNLFKRRLNIQSWNLYYLLVGFDDNKGWTCNLFRLIHLDLKIEHFHHFVVRPSLRLLAIRLLIKPMVYEPMMVLVSQSGAVITGRMTQCKVANHLPET